MKAKLKSLTKEIEALKLKDIVGTKQGYQAEIHEVCTMCHNEHIPSRIAHYYLIL